MKVIRILVLCSTSALALCGLAMVYMASVRGTYVPGVNLIQTRHAVTPEMAEQVKKLDRKIGKFFQLPDTSGKPVAIGGQGPKPQFIYFVKKGCPCSYDAEPIFHKLYDQFAGKIDFISVTDADMASAKQWAKDLEVPYPVVADPKIDVMEAYEAPAATYISLLDQNGLIVKRWAGYSQDYLKEMNEDMSKLIGEPARPFDAQYAPKIKTTGCAFDNYQETKQ
ncbi:MAG: redoxin domain-containing protein [Armatimonadetes bacterium]|nr:redoxin domain-containing protein [Armatimonadota bacterium]MBS1728200.1 TlpA family protein disulfide reductase [Armatimonadota bacterium]